MALKNADAAAKKRLDEMARNAAGANTSGGKKAAVDAKFGGGDTSERSAYNRLYQLAQQSVQEQAQLKAQAASAQRQPTVSMRQGTKQTSTAESRLSQRRFDATSFPSTKLRDEAIAAQQRANDDTLDRKIELTQERLQTTLPKKETPAGMIDNPEYQALYGALSGYQSQKKSAEQEAKDAADAYNSASGMDAKKIAGLYVAPYFKKGTNISDATALLDEYLTYQDAMQNGVVGAGEKWKTARAALIGAGLSEDGIDEAADIWRRASNSEAMSLSNQSWAEATREHPILASALSVPLSITSGLGYLDLATQKIGNPDKAIDFNTGTMRAAGAGAAIRETAVEGMNGLESFLYQTGMSMADSTAIAALSQFGVPGASVLLSGSAATSAAREAKERGGTDAQALGYGLAAGIAEGIFETISLEMLTKNAIGRLGRQAAEQAGTQRILTLLKSAGIQAATEGSEEVFTTIANTISDAVIMGDKSEYAQNKQLYMDAGMSEDEAKKKAAEDWLTGILGDFLGGALSGGIMGGAASAISANTQYTFDDEAPSVDQASQQETPQDILQRVAMESVQEQMTPGQAEQASSTHPAESQAVLRGASATNQNANQAVQENQSTENQTALERFANQVVNEDREKQQKSADQLGATLGVNGAESFSREYKESDGSLPAEEAFEGYRALYKSALSGAEMSESGKNAAAKLPQNIARAALVAGQQDAARARNAKYFGREESLVRDDNFKKAHLSSRTARALEAVGRATGTQIRFAENVTDSDGSEANASYNSGVITISLKAENPVSAALSHEVVHRIREVSPDAFEALARYVTNNMDALGMKLRRKQTELVYNTDNASDITEEIVADAFGTMSGMTDVLNQFAADERSAAQKIADVLHDIVNAVKRILSNQNIKLSKYEQESFASLLKDSETMAGVFDTALRKTADAIAENGAKKTGNGVENLTESQIHQRVVENKPVSASDAVKHSRKYNTEYMDAAEKKNKNTGFVTDETMKQARTARQAIADIFNDPDLQDSLGLPPDIIGNTYIPNGSYSGTEENSTVCIRSIAADALMDAVAEYLGRPLTVEDTITISQELFNFTDKPECLYCYVAMDRKAYREFLGSYLKQRDDVFEDIKNGMSEDEAYQKFLNGRKDTAPMQKRFSMWVSLYKQGKPRIDANDLASAANQEKAIERDRSLTAQINDARKYAQSASWAKKRLSYAAYNNHILKWAQSRIDNLNSNYGLRMYSFSDFSPAFILENMQMITDAAARGLKVLAYTKELDFVRIFAETGMNINISAFGYDDKATGAVAQDGMQGADWEPAKELRKQYDNVGITFVATNDAQVEWALAQDWIDVVIPFHLVRTGEKVASYFGWRNYKDVQDDIKTKEFDKATDKRHILPPDHQNNKELYLEACRRNHLTPRFEKWVDNENYMKLVNETRRSEAETPTVQPVFDVDAAKESISTMIKRGGYYKPIGGDIEGMQDIATEIGEKIDSKKKLSRRASDYESALEELKADTQFSQELDIDRLSKENARLKARVERLKGEMKKTKEKTVRKADVDKLARRIVKEYSSTVSASEISEELKAIGDSIVQGGEHMTYEALMDSLMPIADYVVKNARVLNDQLYQEYKELRDDLRTTRMTLSEPYRNDLAGYESYNDFRKHYRGKLLLTNDGIPVDVKYQELSSQYPEYFSADILHPADQLTRIADVLDSLAPVYENPNSIAFDAAANEAANEMLDTLIGEDVRQTAPTYADRQEKRLQETRARYQRELARVRESRDEKIKKLKERHKAQESEAVEKRRASELRGKLLKHTEELSRRLLRPTDTKHIPEALRSSVASVLESINLESKRAPNRSQRFSKLKEAYKSIAGETVIDPSLLGGDGQTGLLDQIVAMGDKPISDMNSSELNVIWNAVRSVEASVQNANRMLTRGKFRAASEWAQRFKTDTDSRKNKRGSRITIDLEDPYTFFSHYGESGKAVYRMLRNAQDDARTKLDQIIEDVQNIVDPKAVKNAQRARHEFTLVSGEKLTLTTGQIMGLYNLSQRQQAQDHLLKGGIVQPEIKRSGGKPKIERGTRLVALTEKDLASFFSVLSGEEKNTARSLQSITATTLAKWGNEASMKAYGYKKFTGTDYWPIHSAGEVLQSSADRSGSNVRSIANIGLAKAVIPGANNAIDVYDVFDDFAQHTADMIDYATWLLPMEDANRLFNYRYKDESGRTTGTIKGILDENGGKGAQQYWSKLMENIQNGVRGETDAMSTVMNKMYGNVKAAAVGANIRVIAQQPTAFVRAAAVLDPLNMARGLVKGVTKGDGWEKAKRYAPIARIKDAGSFDQSNFKSISSELYGSGTVLSKLSDKAGSPAAAADAVTWGRLWNACEWQVFRENRSIAPGSEAFYGKTAELFTDMVDQTQVVDGILQRSQVMRSGNSITKQATSFMGEPIKSLNVLLRSWDKLRYETDSTKKKAAAKTFARAAAALTATDLVNAAVQSLIDAIRDDDEDKKYWERWLTAFTGISGDEESMSEIINNVLMKGNVADNMNPLGRIPFANDIWSLIQGYSVDRMDMSAVSDFVDAASTFVKNIGGDGRYTQAYAAKQLLSAASKVFGVSVFNVTRDAWGIARTAAVETGDVWAQYQMEKVIYNISSESNKNRYMDILYRALESGDTELYLKIAAELIDDEPNGINGKSIESAMRSRFEKHKAENSSYKLPAGMEEIIRIVPTYQEDEPETYDVSNLSAAAYQTYMEQRAANYEQAVGDVLELPYFKSLDEAAQAKVYGYIDKLTHSYALSAASDGDYTITTNWIADAAGAEAKGISTAKYALFHLAYVSLTSDKDKKGKTIKGRAKSDKVEDWLNKQGFTKPQKKYLWETVYSEKTNPF